MFKVCDLIDLDMFMYLETITTAKIMNISNTLKSSLLLYLLVISIYPAPGQPLMGVCL